ncbi:unnamed protein product [Pleuronectes platessa]|uniref:polynucleotide adenylyltransferase n=1 Tax=Pleuronectes platessa TaxID=8262 RepID=A0A9N7UXA8_PLEPL|nr:unnamed protein product [Pleuronectes platessa]
MVGLPHQGAPGPKSLQPPTLPVICNGNSVYCAYNKKQADIDAPCAGPVFLERTVFFTSFFKKIKAQEEAKDIQVDLVYAHMLQRSLGDTLNLLDDMWLKDMDKASARSLNGYRATEEILRLVPNISTFRLALIAIKLWAKIFPSGRNIYSSKLGFLSGVSWDILVARICQFNPNVTASRLGLAYPYSSEGSTGDQYHLMLIITPAYPQQNSAFKCVSLLADHPDRGDQSGEGLSTKWVIGFTLTEEYKIIRNKNDIGRNITDTRILCYIQNQQSHSSLHSCTGHKETSFSLT